MVVEGVFPAAATIGGRPRCVPTARPTTYAMLPPRAVGQLCSTWVVRLALMTSNPWFDQEAFLSNVCAQLIVRYGLDHPALPAEATQDGGFLSGLLSEVAATPEREPS